MSKVDCVKCPHCNEYVLIDSIACGIFRHGIYKSNYKQINPHAPKNFCDDLVTKDIIFGCGKPFKYMGTGEPVMCDYV